MSHSARGASACGHSENALPKKETDHWRNSHKRPMAGSGPEHVLDSGHTFLPPDKPGAGSKIYSLLNQRLDAGNANVAA